MTTTDGFEWPIGDPLFEVSLDAIAEGIDGNGVLASGDLQVTATANANEIQVAAGDLWYAGSVYSLGAAETHVLTDGNATYDRWDSVVFDTGTGSSTVLEGNAEANPEPPSPAAGQVLLAYIYVASGETDVTDSEIKNFRVFSTDAADVRLNDSAGDYSSTEVEGALTEVVRNVLGTDVGAFGDVIDADVTSTPTAGTEQSYGFGVDGNTLLKLYAEADGSGGIQDRRRVELPESDFRLGEPGVDSQNEIQNYTVDNNGNIIKAAWGFYAGGGWYLRLSDETNGTNLAEMNLAASGIFYFKNQIRDNKGNVIYDYANEYVPTNILQTIELGSDTDRNLSGNDLNDSAGPGTLYDSATGEFPRGVLDDEAATTVVSSSTYTTSDEEVILVDTATIGASSTITLASADLEQGHTIIISGLSGAAASYPITVETEGTETIDGVSSKTISTDYAGATFVAEGNNWVVPSPPPLDPVKQVEGAESGAVAAGEQGTLIFDHLQDGETLEIHKAVFTLDDGTPVPTSLDLIIATLDNSGSYTIQTTVYAGDGATVWDGDPANSIGDPLASYTNSSGGGETVAVLADNGTSASYSIMAKATGERVP
jgi:hypothetical protein